MHRLGFKSDDRTAAAPAAAVPRTAAPRGIYRLGPWTVGVNWKLARALGLAALVWALIVAVLLSL